MRVVFIFIRSKQKNKKNPLNYEINVQKLWNWWIYLIECNKLLTFPFTNKPLSTCRNDCTSVL